MKLIDTTSDLYRKRLVRELNATSDGFYASHRAGHRVHCNRARLTNGKLQVRYATALEWFSPARDTFSDPYGQEIVASRAP